MKQAFTAKDLAALKLPGLPRTARNIRSLADREQWHYTFKKCRGPACRAYTTKLLPDAIRTAINAAIQAPVAGRTPPSTMSAGNNGAGTAVSLPQQKKAMLKADLLRLYSRALAEAPWGRKQPARDGFMSAYNSGIAYPTLYKALGPVSWKTIDGWQRTVAQHNGDTFALADRRGMAKRGKTSMTTNQTDILLRCVLRPNRPRISEAIRMARAVMQTRQIANGHSDATYRRWIEQWKSLNHHIWTFSREGAKAWNDKCAMYIERDYSLINVGDILVADGHTLNFEILNPFTGKAKRMTLIVWLDMKSTMPLGWEIMPTEDTAAINSALRRAIMMLGFYPKVGYLDNGRAFRSRFFEGCADFSEAGFAGLYERLGMKTIHAWPYHGQSKTVERFFGTFAELERWCPTYTGTDIAHKPPRMNRGERLHRQAYEKAFGGQVITLEQAHRAIAAWFDEYARRPQRGHLDGAAPLDLFMEAKGAGVDPTELSFLMMSIEVKHINRNGIRFRGRNYYHPELYGRRHAVTVRYDLQDTSAVLVYDQHDELLCVAEPVDQVHPAAAQLGDDGHVQQLAKQIEHKKHQEKEASRVVRDFLEAEVLPEHKRQLAAMGIEPGSPAAPEEQKSKKITLNKEQLAARVEQIRRDTRESEAAGFDRELEELPEADRYLRLLEMEARSQLIPKRWQGWMAYFSETPEHEKHAEFFEERRTIYMLMHQSEQSGG